METDEKKSKSNILNIENGFNTRVNLYIIQYLYYHLKKAAAFIIDEQEQEKGKKKSEDLKKYIGMSRQRLGRIYNGHNYSMDIATAQKISGLFNISTDYFKKYGELIGIYNITQEDWKCYFYTEYKNSTTQLIKSKNEINQGMKKVKNCLKDLLKENYIVNHYDTSTPIYRIYYYFTKGVSFKEVTTLNKFLENLELLKISDWKELTDNPDQIKKYIPLLKKHYEYISAYITCREYEKN